MEMDWLKYLVSILAGLSAAIPLVVQLVKYIKEAVKQRNWSVVLAKVMDLMEAAETKFAEGAERKEWVLAMLKASADGINYDIDYDAIADMIDSLCNMSCSHRKGEEVIYGNRNFAPLHFRCRWNTALFHQTLF